MKNFTAPILALCLSAISGVALAQSTATPNFQDKQDYLKPAPLGINALYSWAMPNGKGENIRIIDIENNWNKNHEDLPPFFYDSLIYNSANNGAHGTGVLGIMVARDNGIGITGIANKASIGVQSFYTTPGKTSYYEILGGSASQNCIKPKPIPDPDPATPPNELNPACFITAAAEQAMAGDIILIENVGCTWMPFSPCPTVPLEWYPAVFKAIKKITDRGIIVITAVGNSGSNLDSSIYVDTLSGRNINPFDRNIQDSGAIFVGASTSTADRAPNSTTNYGSRVDVHSWGENIYSTGGNGEMVIQGDQNRKYTTSFSGTSGAAPIVAAAAANIQSIRKGLGLPLLNSYQMRDLLKNTGTPQSTTISAEKHIGPQPDLKQAIESFLQTITFNDYPTSLELGKTGTLLATSSRGLPVTFTAQPSNVCTVSNNVITAVGVGGCTVTANQLGNSDFAAANQVVRGFSVTTATPSAPVIQSITITSGNATIAFTPSTFTGGAAVSYKATCTAPGKPSLTATGISTPLVVNNLVSDVAYSCSVTANNGQTSAASASLQAKVDEAFGFLIKTPNGKFVWIDL